MRFNISKKQPTRKILAFALSLCMVLALLPATVQVAYASTEVTADSVAELQSDHPYASNEDKIWIYTSPASCDYLEITFSADTNTEVAYDYIYIMDGENNQIADSPFDGSALAGQTVTVPGQTVKIRLTSDGGVEYYGFQVTAVNPGIESGPITNLKVSSYGENSVGLKFSRPKNADSVLIQQSDDGGGTWTAASTAEALNAGSTSAVVTSLTEGVTYRFKLVVTGGDREGESNVVSETPSYYTRAEEFTFASYGAGTCEINGYTGALGGNIRIPPVIGGNDVIGIGDSAFRDKGKVTSVVIPDSVMYIGMSAFKNCSKLESVVIPDGVAGIGANAFQNCDALQSVSVPGSVLSIGNSAFSGCDVLQSVSIADGVQSVGNSAFGWCYELRSRLNIPGSVTSIGSDAFTSCGRLEAVIIQDGTESMSIGAGAFGNCTILLDVEIPARVTSIAGNAFYSASSILAIYGMNSSYAHTFANGQGFTFVAIDPPLDSGVFSGGNGSRLYPYLIETEQQLRAVNNNLTAAYRLENDLVLTGEWTPIASAESANFTGTFDGGGHTVSDVRISEVPAGASNMKFGFFGHMGYPSVVKNLGLEVDIGGPDFHFDDGGFSIGGLAGIIHHTKISNCYVTGSIDASSDEDLDYRNGIGGFAGETYGFLAKISNCYADVAVSVDMLRPAAAGFIGYVGDEVTIENSYSAGPTDLNAQDGHAGGFICIEDGAVPVITSSYYNSDSYTYADNGYGEGKTTAEMMDASEFSGWDFEDTWEIQPGVSYPYLKHVVPNPLPGHYAATVTVNKDGSVWSTSTPVITIGTTSGTASANGSAFVNGTYNIYADGADTGADITVSGAAATATLSYYTLTLTAGTGITSVSGGGVYLSGTTANIDAVVTDGYTWEKWSDEETDKARTVTVTATTTLTASATLTPPAFVAVTEITGVSASSTAGTPLTLTGTVAPANATNQTIVWSVKDPGATGAMVSGDTLSATGAGTVVVTATITNGTSETTNYTQDFTITVSDASATTYTVTFNNNGSVHDTRTVNAGLSIGSGSFPADPTRSSYTFGGWFAGENGAGTQFTAATPVNATMTVYAKWTYRGGGGGGGSSGGGTPQNQYNAEVEKDGRSGGTIPVEIDKITGEAEIDTKPLGDLLTSGGHSIITVPAIEDVDAFKIRIPVSDLKEPGRPGYLTVNTDMGSVTVPSNMLTGVKGTDGQMAEITISQGDKSSLPPDICDKVGDRPFVQLTLTIDGKQTDWNNSKAPVTVSVPYTPTAEELKHPNCIVVWYIDGDGKAQSVPNGRYDPKTGMVTFATTHFSDYVAVYNNVSFSDVSDTAWYAPAVSFIAAREITTGTGGGRYSPEAKLTRGEFIVLMMRAYGIAPDENPTDNFSDAGDTYYTGYLAAAKRLGISAGAGDNRYAPGKEITRQEMFTLLYNALKTIGQLPEGESDKTLAGFSDREDSASWAKEAMTLLVQTGIVGGSGGKLNTNGTATRAEMAQVLYNLLGK